MSAQVRLILNILAYLCGASRFYTNISTCASPKEEYNGNTFFHYRYIVVWLTILQTVYTDESLQEGEQADFVCKALNEKGKRKILNEDT